MESLKDLQIQRDNLYSELERKDRRLFGLRKDLQGFRSAQEQQQSEIKTLNVMREKLSQDKEGVSNKLAKAEYDLKVYQKEVSGLKGWIDKANILTSDDWNIQMKDLAQRNIVQQGEISILLEKIAFIENELEVSHRAVALKNRYEGLGRSEKVNIREQMRSLYIELSKKENENHRLSLALAEAEEGSTKAKESSRLFEQSNSKLLGNTEELTRQTFEYTEQIEAQYSVIESLNKASHRQQIKIEELNKRIEAKESTYLQTQRKEEELEHILSAQSEEVKILHDELEQRKSDHDLTHIHFIELQSENNALREQLRRHEQLLVKCGSLESSVQESLSEKRILEKAQHTLEGKVSNLKESLDKSKQEVSVQRDLIVEYKEKTEELEKGIEVTAKENERLRVGQTEALDALQRTILAARELSTELHREKELRHLAETAILQMTRTSSSSNPLNITVHDAESKSLSSAVAEGKDMKAIWTGVGTVGIGIGVGAGAGGGGNSPIRSADWQHFLNLGKQHQQRDRQQDTLMKEREQGRGQGQGSDAKMGVSVTSVMNSSGGKGKGAPTVSFSNDVALVEELHKLRAELRTMEPPNISFFSDVSGVSSNPSRTNQTFTSHAS